MNQRTTWAAVIGVMTAPSFAQFVHPDFQDEYVITDLGSVTGLPVPYGGLTFLAEDADTLLIGGAANDEAGAIYAVPLERNCTGHIVGFAGDPVLHATAPYIDGGLAYGPDGVLFFTVFPFNRIGQIRPGSVEPAKITELSPLGVTPSVGTLQFTPPGFAGAGSLKITSYSGGGVYDAGLVADGNGTFDLVDVTLTVTTGGGPEGLAYVDETSPQLTTDSVLVTMYNQWQVVAFDADDDGNPVPGTQRVFITGSTTLIAAAIDPVTGDFLFSTFGDDNRVMVVNGFRDPCRADFAPSGGDGETGINDFLSLLGAWGQTCVPQDIDESTVVDVIDLLALLNLWGPCQ